MDNVIEIKGNTTIETLEELLRLAKEDKIDNLLVAGFSNDSTIISAKAGNLSLIEQQHLTSYLQVNTMLRVIEEK